MRTRRETTIRLVGSLDISGSSAELDLLACSRADTALRVLETAPGSRRSSRAIDSSPAGSPVFCRLRHCPSSSCRSRMILAMVPRSIRPFGWRWPWLTHRPGLTAPHASVYSPELDPRPTGIEWLVDATAATLSRCVRRGAGRDLRRPGARAGPDTRADAVWRSFPTPRRHRAAAAHRVAPGLPHLPERGFAAFNLYCCRPGRSGPGPSGWRRPWRAAGRGPSPGARRLVSGYQANCPACGSPIAFELGLRCSRSATLRSCRGRKGADLPPTQGGRADPDAVATEAGARRALRGRARVPPVGRLQLDYGAGTWDEWLMGFLRHLGLLSESQGKFHYLARCRCRPRPLEDLAVARRWTWARRAPSWWPKCDPRAS